MMDRDKTPSPLLQHRSVLRGHTDYVLCLAMSGDGRRLVSGAMDETVRVWDAGTGRKVVVLRSQFVLSVAISPDGQRIFIGSKAGTIRVRDAETGERLATMRGHCSGIYNMFFQNGGRELATWDVNDESRVWDAATGECLGSGAASRHDVGRPECAGGLPVSIYRSRTTHRHQRRGHGRTHSRGRQLVLEHRSLKYRPLGGIERIGDLRLRDVRHRRARGQLRIAAPGLRRRDRRASPFPPSLFLSQARGGATPSQAKGTIGREQGAPEEGGSSTFG